MYWSVGYSSKPEELAAQGALEAKIKVQIILIGSLIQLVSDKRRHASDELARLMLELTDAATGGDFETVTRKPDKQRLMKVGATISRIAVELQRQKLWAGVWPDVISNIFGGVRRDLNRPD